MADSQSIKDTKSESEKESERVWVCEKKKNQVKYTRRQEERG